MDADDWNVRSLSVAAYRNVCCGTHQVTRYTAFKHPHHNVHGALPPLMQTCAGFVAWPAVPRASVLCEAARNTAGTLCEGGGGAAAVDTCSEQSSVEQPLACRSALVHCC